MHRHLGPDKIRGGGGALTSNGDRVLITGGAGFIGSHLADAFVRDGVPVAALDDLSTGRRDNIRHLLTHPMFQFVQGSVLDAPLVDALVHSCRHIYHLGAVVGVQRVMERPRQTIEVNVRGTQVVLEAAARHGRSFFLASTSEVYGRGTDSDRPFRETDEVRLRPTVRWGYAASKALDEYLVRAMAEETGLQVVIGRFFNTVGPRQSAAYGMVLPRFITQALEGAPITVYGDGRQVRTFTAVTDAVRAVRGLMDHPDASGQTFNIGGDEPVTIMDLAERVRRLTESVSEIVCLPYEEIYGKDFEDARHRIPDLSKITALIGYRPAKTVDDIIHDMVTHIRSERLGEGEDDPS